MNKQELAEYRRRQEEAAKSVKPTPPPKVTRQTTRLNADKE